MLWLRWPRVYSATLLPRGHRVYGQRYVSTNAIHFHDECGITNDETFIEMMNIVFNMMKFASQLMDFVFKMMDFVFKMMNFVFKMMKFVFRMMDVRTECQATDPARR